ncbi:MAG: preprotein translocase subunit SecE [Fimbriimonadaceae bacterium]
MAKSEPRSNKPRTPAGTPTPSVRASRGGLKGFFADVMREMKKVSWPSPKDTRRLTGVVMAVCGLIILILTMMGYLVEFGLKILVSR